MGNHRVMMRTSLLLALLVAGHWLWAAEGLTVLQGQAERGDPWAQLNLGAAYDNGIGVAAEPAQAVHWYRRAAEQGLAQAQFNLGHSYATGNGVAQDYAEAVRWLVLAARQGMAEAQHLLAVCYLEGLGVKVDRAEAQQWLSQAAAQHYQPALDYAQRHHLEQGE
ncbi:MAG TPA: tetratricopeptide repeat protein [Gammaproteobacteria bacterium]